MNKELARRARRRTDRGAVTAEKALLTILVIAFGAMGITLVGNPMRDHVFRVVYMILLRIYELITTGFGFR